MFKCTTYKCKNMQRRKTVVTTKKYVPVSRRLWVEKRRNIQCYIVQISKEPFSAFCWSSVLNE
jgi:hypothetical protein